MVTVRLSAACPHDVVQHAFESPLLRPTVRDFPFTRKLRLPALPLMYGPYV